MLPMFYAYNKTEFSSFVNNIPFVQGVEAQSLNIKMYSIGTSKTAL